MKIAELKRLPDTCGFVSFTQELNIQSTVGRRLFLNSDFLTDRPSIIRELSNTDSMLAFIDKEHHKKDIASILLLLSEVKDIEKTLTNLDNNKILNDIELFEIKNFSFTAKKLLEIVYRYTSNNELYIDGQKEVDFVVFDETIRILDPENSGIPTFYIYDAYSEDLAALRYREQNETDSEQLAEIQAQILDIEQEIRSSLSQQLKPHSNDLLTALNNIAYIDLLIAKAAMANSFGLCCPEVSENKTEYIGIFNPEVKAKLQERGSKYQETDIDFGRFPTLITGINMGGKTLMLKTLYLCQMLFQYGFFVPAGRAKIMIMSGILFSFTDEQNQLQGLSSFAAEMKKIDEIIKQISTDHNLLILIDELARTTNPQEGAAIVSATLEILQENSVCAFITTHYDITTSCRRLRVRGLKENVSETASNYKSTDYIRNLLKNIDYQLINDTSGNTPNEAIRIAELLGTDNRLIDKAKGKIAH
ncbi:MAG: DNA mismatch repair protein MutS [Bacteroidota bacterium]